MKALKILEKLNADNKKYETDYNKNQSKLMKVNAFYLHNYFQVKFQLDLVLLDNPEPYLGFVADLYLYYYK